MITAEELLKYDIAPVPKYLLLRDVMNLKHNDSMLLQAKNDLLKTKWVNQVLKRQNEDGGFGYFHSLSTASVKRIPLTTEQALRRLKVLGLSKEDIYIQKAISYMEKYLKGEVDYPDRKEKLHDWTIFTQLITATQIRQFDLSNKAALTIAHRWTDIIEYAFSGNNYNQNLYEEAYKETFNKKPKGARLQDYANFYFLALLKGMLSKETEKKMLHHIINNPNGIYYVYDEAINSLPDKFASNKASRYLNAVELLAEYKEAKEMLQFIRVWLINNSDIDGLWDMGSSVKNGIEYPISDSWRKNINRKIDCTVRIMALQKKLW